MSLNNNTSACFGQRQDTVIVCTKGRQGGAVMDRHSNRQKKRVYVNKRNSGKRRERKIQKSRKEKVVGGFEEEEDEGRDGWSHYY